MIQRCFVLCCALVAPVCGIAQDSRSGLQERLGDPYTAIFQMRAFSDAPHQAQSLRSIVKHERDQQIEACGRDEKQLRNSLGGARKGLRELNQRSSRDGAITASARENLHTQIAALERVLQDKHEDCEHGIPVAFEIEFAKVDLFQRWPERRRQADQVIRAGLARQRKYGDVDDIGYRKLVEGQEKDIPLGQQALRQIALNDASARIQDVEVQQYVQRLADRIARKSDLRIPLHVTVLDAPDVNAVAIPGGFVLLTSGLLLSCETEAEFAGVVSQQSAHVAARHGARASKLSFVQRMLAPAAQIVTGVLTGGVSNAGAYYAMSYGFQGLGMLMDRSSLRSSGTAQAEADQLGIQYAWNAGFDPKGFIEFLDTLAKEREFSKTAAFFLTKPSLGERLLNAFSEIEYLPERKDYIRDSPEFRRVRERLRRTGS